MVTLTARLEPDLDAFITTYQTRHQLSRTEVIREALRALQQLERQQELRAGYQRMAQDFAREESDPWLDSGLQETLESTT